MRPNPKPCRISHFGVLCRLPFSAAIVGLSVLVMPFADFVARAGADVSPNPARSAGDQVDALVEQFDPAKDEWPTEAYHDRIKHQLAGLGQAIEQWSESDLENGPTNWCSWFAPNARCDAIEPYAPPADARPSSAFGWKFHSRSAGENARTVTPAAFLKSFVQPHAGGSGVRVAFKIISVQTGPIAGRSKPVDAEVGDGQRIATDVLVEMSSSGSLQVQQNGQWTVIWRLEAGDDHPRIEHLECGDLQMAAAYGRLYDEATRSLFPDEHTWSPQLAMGSDYWHTHIDAVGEMNFMGHEGIAVGDVNGDGLDDLYVAMGNGLPNKLLVQQPDGTVRDTATEAGVDWLDATKGVLLVDMDNDDDEDLLLAMGPSVVLCRNDGTGRFQPVRSSRASTPAAFYSLAAADYDQDGDVDVYATRYVKVAYGVSVPMPMHDANNGPTNHLLRNDGDAGFTDVTAQVGLGEHNGRFSLAASWCDVDNDGDPDLYVANDFGRNNLYRNDAGRFTDIAAGAGAEDQAAGMGVSWADVDWDGDYDLHVSNMFSSAGRRVAHQPGFLDDIESARLGVQRHSLGNSLLVNELTIREGGGGALRFADRSDAAGIRVGRWAWGSMFADIDNDGFDDLVVPNGFLSNTYKDDL